MSSSAWPEKVHKDIAGDWHTVSRFNYTENLGYCGEKQNIRLW